MELEIKSAEEKDIPVVEDILMDVVQWMNRSGRQQWSTEDVAWENLRKEYQIGDFYIAYRQKEAVACMALQDYDPVYWPDISRGKALFLHKLAVKRVAAGQGLAASMIAYAKSCCRMRGIEQLCLDCWRDRTKLRELYEANGFVCVREEILFNRYDAAFYQCRMNGDFTKKKIVEL